MKTAVIYARYSSDSQTEQSIEGQLRECEEYAKKNKILYVDYHKEMADERGGLPPELSPDEVHPNLEGYKVMEGILLKALAKAKK